MKNKNNIIILIVIVIIIIFAIVYLRKGTVDDSSLSTDTQISNSADATLVYTLLKKMSFVKLDDSIFSNQLFINLKDNTVLLDKQEVGRENPFSPIGRDAGSFSTTTR